MQAFRQLFPRKTSVIGMIHVDPLPGTPGYKSGSFNRLLEKAKYEAEIYKNSKIVSFLKFFFVKNFHNVVGFRMQF
jgi:predicted TIM-barrel enzyme